MGAVTTIPRDSDHLARAIALANDLPPLSPLARHLLATISAPGEGPSLREVASWIEKDIMTAKNILKSNGYSKVHNGGGWSSLQNKI